MKTPQEQYEEGYRSAMKVVFFVVVFACLMVLAVFGWMVWFTTN